MSLMIILLWETDSGLLCPYKQQILFLPPEHPHFHSQRFFLRLELSVMSGQQSVEKDMLTVCLEESLVLVLANPLPRSFQFVAPSVSSAKHR